MNRNFVVGFVVFALVLSGTSIGIATYLSAKDAETFQNEVRKELASAADVAPVPEPSPVPVEPVPSSAPSGTPVYAMGDDYAIWSDGRLLVTHTDSERETVVFEVVPDVKKAGSKGTGAETRVGGRLGVKGELTVEETSRLADLESSGKVSAASLTTGRFVADTAGRIDARSMALADDLNVGGSMIVTGNKFQVGSNKQSPPMYFEAKGATGNLVVVGTITATNIVQTSQIVDWSSQDAVFRSVTASDSVAAKNVVASQNLSVRGGEFVVDAAGGAFSGNLSVGEKIAAKDVVVGNSIRMSGNGFSVASNGDTVARNVVVNGTLGVSGAASFGTVSASSLSAASGMSVATNKFRVDVLGNTELAGTLDVGGDFAVGSDKFTVAAASGDTNVGGALTVAGPTSVEGLSASGTISGANLASTGGLTINTNRFTVAGASGNTAIAGTLGVNGAITADSDVDVAGRLNVVGDSTFGSVTASDLLVDTGLAVAGDKFVVDAAGNTDVAGTLTVDGDLEVAGAANIDGTVTAGAFTTTGNVTAANIPHTAFGVVKVTGGSETVAVAGMPSTAAVVVTPREPVAAADYYVTVADGEFTIEADNRDFSWVAMW